MKPPSLTERRRMAEEWNRKFGIGQAVEVTLDSGEIMQTKTTSRADLLGGHTPVIWLEGITGAYLLSRVRPSQ